MESLRIVYDTVSEISLVSDVLRCVCGGGRRRGACGVRGGAVVEGERRGTGHGPTKGRPRDRRGCDGGGAVVCWAGPRPPPPPPHAPSNPRPAVQYGGGGGISAAVNFGDFGNFGFQIGTATPPDMFCAMRAMPCPRGSAATVCLVPGGPGACGDCRSGAVLYHCVPHTIVLLYHVRLPNNLFVHPPCVPGAVVPATVHKAPKMWRCRHAPPPGNPPPLRSFLTWTLPPPPLTTVFMSWKK